MEPTTVSLTNITFGYVNQNEQTEHASGLEARFAVALHEKKFCGKLARLRKMTLFSAQCNSFHRFLTCNF